MPRYRVGNEVEIVRADCGDTRVNCDCGRAGDRLNAVGLHGTIAAVHKSWGHRADNPHHYMINGEGIAEYNLFTDAQLRRYHSQVKK